MKKKNDCLFKKTDTQIVCKFVSIYSQFSKQHIFVFTFDLSIHSLLLFFICSLLKKMNCIALHEDKKC